MKRLTGAMLIAAAFGCVLRLGLVSAAVQRSDDADARAAWAKIEKSAPYEWEGDWRGQAAWTLAQYGTFLADYPRHPLAADAKFKMATATWAQGGYVEVFHLIIGPGGWEVERKRAAELETWFDTKGFGGGAGEPIAVHPETAVKAQQMYREIVSDWPSSSSAAMSQYYVAVIFDHCLHQPQKALPEFETFVQKYSKTEPFVTKARARITAIRRSAGR